MPPLRYVPGLIGAHAASLHFSGGDLKTLQKLEAPYPRYFRAPRPLLAFQAMRGEAVVGYSVGV